MTAASMIAAPMTAAIDVRGLHAGYGRSDVLAGIDFTVPQGQVAGLLGPNGSGKTTLLLALAGALPIRRGRALVDGPDGVLDVAATPARRMARAAASVPQKADSAFGLTCGTVVLMGRYPHLGFFGGYGPADRDLAAKAMDAAGVAHLAGRPVDEVSGGEMQRVLFARALCQQARVLLLDEPAASLDIAGQLAVFGLVRQLAAQGGAALCAVHDLNLAALYCHCLIFLKHGRVAEAGPTEKVFTQEVLTRVYDTDIRISSHPVTGAPQAHFVPA